MRRKVIMARTPADLILAVYAAEGWTRDMMAAGASATPTRAGLVNTRYTVTADPRRNRYIATPKNA